MTYSQCYTGYNRAWFTKSDSSSDLVTCAARIQTFMNSAVDTETCLRRGNLIRGLGNDISMLFFIIILIKLISSLARMCDPLGDQNIITMVPVRVQTDVINPASVLLLTARVCLFICLF
jgi:hypothetical protein